MRVFLIDDHPIVREGLRRVLESDPNMEVVGEAGDGQEASEKILDSRADIAIVDMVMPGLDGLQTTRLLKRLSPSIKIIAFTMREERNILQAFLEAGASGYVLKCAKPSEIIHALRSVAGAGVFIDARLAGNLVTSFLRDAGVKPAPGATLTHREHRVLHRVAEGHTGKAIAAELSLSVKTVETYKARGMAKLGLRHRADIVAYAARMGWLE